MKVDLSGDEVRLYDFNALEAFRIARKMESEGIKLYKSMREKIKDPGVRDVLDFLIEEEKKHLALFENMVEKLSKTEEADTDLVDIADSQIMSELTGIDNLEELLFSSKEVLKLGISVEQRAISFYNQLLENTSDPDGRKSLEMIIEEEKMHAEKFKSLL